MKPFLSSSVQSTALREENPPDFPSLATPFLSWDTISPPGLLLASLLQKVSTDIQERSQALSASTWGESGRKNNLNLKGCITVPKLCTGFPSLFPSLLGSKPTQTECGHLTLTENEIWGGGTLPWGRARVQPRWASARAPSLTPHSRTSTISTTSTEGISQIRFSGNQRVTKGKGKIFFPTL